MGWGCEHLYRFNIGGVEYADLAMVSDEDVEDACATTLSEVLPIGNRAGRPNGVRGPGQLPRLGRRGECPGTHHAPGVNRPETGMGSPGMLIKHFEQVSDERGRHAVSLRKGLSIKVSLPG
jgi:hypothetical protein